MGTSIRIPCLNLGNFDTPSKTFSPWKLRFRTRPSTTTYTPANCPSDATFILESNPTRIIEELVANSYDADATIVLVVHSPNELIVIDNGTGIAEEQFSKLLDLGAGTKIVSHQSDLKRSYLGSFG